MYLKNIYICRPPLNFIPVIVILVIARPLGATSHCHLKHNATILPVIVAQHIEYKKIPA